METAVPGKWGYRCTGMSYINFPRVLLCAMNNGVDLTSKKRFTKGYGYFTEMETYEDLLAAWDKTVREMTRYSVIVENAIDKASEKDVPDVLCSALTDDCFGRGKTIKEGGAVCDFFLFVNKLFDGSERICHICDSNLKSGNEIINGTTFFDCFAATNTVISKGRT